MKKDESFDEFYAKLKNIVNLAFNLGEIIPELKDFSFISRPMCNL